VTRGERGEGRGESEEGRWKRGECRPLDEGEEERGKRGIYIV
jgi:hypothetical protein